MTSDTLSVGMSATECMGCTAGSNTTTLPWSRQACVQARRRAHDEVCCEVSALMCTEKHVHYARAHAPYSISCRQAILLEEG